VAKFGTAVVKLLLFCAIRLLCDWWSLARGWAGALTSFWFCLSLIIDVYGMKNAGGSALDKHHRRSQLTLFILTERGLKI